MDNKLIKFLFIALLGITVSIHVSLLFFYLVCIKIKTHEISVAHKKVVPITLYIPTKEMQEITQKAGYMGLRPETLLAMRVHQTFK